MFSRFTEKLGVLRVGQAKAYRLRQLPLNNSEFLERSKTQTSLRERFA